MTHNLLKRQKRDHLRWRNEMSIAWKVAERAVEEGATITLSNTPVAVRMGDTNNWAKTKCGDSTCRCYKRGGPEMVFTKSMEILGGKIDFVLHSIGMSPNVRKKRPTTTSTTIAGQDTRHFGHLFPQDAAGCRKLDAVEKGGSMLALTTWLHGVFSTDTTTWPTPRHCWSLSPAAGYIYGRDKGCVNTHLPVASLTTAGSGVKGMTDLMDFRKGWRPSAMQMRMMLRLLHLMFSDLTRKVTMPEPLQRWRLLKHGHEPARYEAVQQRSG